MFKRLFLVLFLATASILAGCGSSNSLDGAYSDIYNGNIPYNLSGNTGTVQLTTSLDGVNGQSVTITRADSVPAEVTEFRFTGFNSSGVQIYSAIKPKASTITLESVPVEVTSLRIELLVEGIAIGGLSTPIVVKNGEVTPITNPSYVFVGGGASAYGSYNMPTATLHGPGDEDDPYSFYAVLTQIGQAIDFANAAAAVNVSRTAPGVYTVAVDGDYMVSYSLLTIYGQVLPNIEFRHLDSQGATIDNLYWLHYVVEPHQVVVSLKANESIGLYLNDSIYPYDDDDITAVPFAQGSVSIMRIGNNTNSKLPESTPIDLSDLIPD